MQPLNSVTTALPENDSVRLNTTLTKQMHCFTMHFHAFLVLGPR